MSILLNKIFRIFLDDMKMYFCLKQPLQLIFAFKDKIIYFFFNLNALSICLLVFVLDDNTISFFKQK